MRFVLLAGKLGVALLVTLTLLTGCGGSSPSSTSTQTADFRTSYVAVANQLKQSSRAIARAIQQASKQTDAQIATAFRNLATRWQNQLSQLQTLKPPSNLSASFNTVTGAASRVEADLTSIASAAATHNAGGAQQASASLVTDILSAKAASTVITNKLGAKELPRESPVRHRRALGRISEAREWRRVFEFHGCETRKATGAKTGIQVQFFAPVCVEVVRVHAATGPEAAGNPAG